ncbi:uncharacterized protein LOC134647511 [Cydia amplana]|uniref:uncharacterized protein LOC134647511 n=1 Tax=Cydia amplana TaxID=1869771 RepID=UPI002FE627C0
MKFFLYSETPCYAWRVIPAHKASYVRRAEEEGVSVDNEVEDFEERLPRNSLHTVYKFGWCKSDVTNRANLFRTSNFTIPHRYVAETQWIYVLDSANSRRFSLQCVVVKVYVPAKYQFKRTRIPFHYCQGSVIYLMARTVGRILMHEFYFMSQFYMPATFVFEYYHPIMM